MNTAQFAKNCLFSNNKLHRNTVFAQQVFSCQLFSTIFKGSFVFSHFVVEVP